MAAIDDTGPQFGLEQVIEAQRAKLASAHAVQMCLYEVLLYADGEDTVMYADAARVVATIVEEVLENLDSVHVRRYVSDAADE